MSIAKLKKKISNLTILNEDVVLQIMNLIRKIIEIKGLKPHLKHLNFYCDWCFHSKLDRNLKCPEILNNVSAVMLSAVDYSKYVTDIFSFDELRNELNQLFKALNLNTCLFCKDHWEYFYGYLMCILTDTPITLEEKNSRNKKEWNKLEELAQNHKGLVCRSIKIIKKVISGNENSEHKVNFIFEIELFKKYVTVHIPLSMGHLNKN